MSVPCSSCHAPLIWLKTPLGKSMPLDAVPNPDGNVVIRDGLAVVLKLAELETETGRRFMAHWATCPHSKSHKKASTDTRRAAL